MRKFAVTASAVTTLFAASLFVAPEASATTDGCGDLTNGVLCIEWPSTPGGNYTTSYWKHDGSDVDVKLGYQTRYQSNEHPKTYDSPWLTAKSGKYTKQWRCLTLDDGWCIRALMKTSDDSFIGKWHCL